ncbi:MAG: hypothetical protein NVV73_02280 [Cellvibrionaceae bacterium]|nr:hypothetical protein [Cellvibrionaceae bacterium]
MFHPSASLDLLQKRAQLLQQLRAFFFARQIMEVDVPALGQNTVTDVHLEPLQVLDTGYLQTSPEYFMKRLLAAGSGSIYYLGKAYRRDESGRRHRAEFTLLEWYSVGLDDRELMAQMTELFALLAPATDIRRRSYGEAFQTLLGLCPHRASLAELQALIAARLELHSPLDNKSACLDLLFSFCVEPQLGPGITFICDYPAEQCAWRAWIRMRKGCRWRGVSRCIGTAWSWPTAIGSCAVRTSNAGALKMIREFAPPLG